MCRKAVTNLDSLLKRRDITLPTKVLLVEAMVFLVILYQCESWTIRKSECWRIDAFKLVLEKTLESPLDCKEIKPFHPKENESWMFIGRTDAEAEAPILWPPDVRSWFTGKDPDAGESWKQEKKGPTEDEMAGWHHQLDGHWVWVNSGSGWWTGRPGVLWFMGSQRVRHDWVTKLNWTVGQNPTWWYILCSFYLFSFNVSLLKIS